MGILRQIMGMMTVLLAALLLAVPAAQAQTISNTASASWTQQGNPFSVNSNTVSFSLDQGTVSIETFVAAAGGQTLNFSAPTCGGSPIALPGTGGSSLAVTVDPATTLRVGNALYFQVSAPAANTDPAAIDSLTATITTTSGDREVLTVFETAANSGVFVGAIQTAAIPPAASHGDCRLSVGAGTEITIATSNSGNGTPIATAQMDVLADPYGLVFDSENGAPVSGVRVMLVDALTGAPARVYADDGVTPWPSVVYTGQPVTDGAGNVHPMLPGEYRFPLVALGQYRIVVLPPAPFTAPSAKTPAQLAGLVRPDGLPMTITVASFGEGFALTSPAPVRVDIPVDHPPVGVTIAKTASRPTALPGDVVFYSVTLTNPDSLHVKPGVTLVDRPSPLLRLRQDTIRVDGQAPAAGALQLAPDGSSFTLSLGDMAPGASHKITYAMAVRADAPAGTAENRAIASDSLGRTSQTGAAVRILREDLASRVTLIGRITDGGCAVDGVHNGIPGVRVVLEDGSFAVTDADGRYHFEGLVPGTHVVQALTNTLPKGGQFADCTRSTRSAGSPSSRFVIGQGGSLIVADFSATLPEGSIVTVYKKAENTAAPSGKGASAADSAAEAAERAAAGADVDWLAKGDGPVDFLFPAIDHNPRAPAIRVVIRHRADQKVELSADGKPVAAVAFEGTRQAPGGRYAVSIWRGIPLSGELTRLSATVRNGKGETVAELKRDVHYSSAPARVELLRDKSRLVADGTTRPVLALRITDRNGRPVHAGLTGEFHLSAPYESAEALDAMQARALTGLGRSAPRWHVKGDDGIAYLELAPTMSSGKLHAEFDLSDGEQRRRQELDAWVEPGKQPWTVVGLAEGTVGKKSVAGQMGRDGRFDSDLGKDARVAVYAKGPIAKGLLLTASYDSAKQRDDQVLMGAIDPSAYYTVFADMSDRRHDAASREKIYARLEGSGFYALYGDLEAGFDQTQLARYQRGATGFKAELSRGGFHAQAFAAKIASTHRRDEIQGGGISGPYRLSSRALVPGSEVVTIEVRDRFRSEVVVSRRMMIRFVDYDIDLLSGTITFKEPVLSRDEALNPQFIVIGYEVDEAARGGAINAGLRADFTTAGGNLRIGGTMITDTSANDGARTNLVAADVKARVGKDTEVRAEIGTSFGNRPGHRKPAVAWLVEAEHHDGDFDLLAYARYAETEFGVGQNSGAELGRRKFGIDARYRLSEAFALTLSGWRDDSLEDSSRRTAVQFGATWRTRRTDARLGVAAMHDRLADGRKVSSTVLEGGLTQRFFDNKLELSAATSIALGKAESIDLPERHRFTARYAVNSDVRLVGSYEIAKGEGIDARTARAGVELTPWTGARISTALGQQNIAEFGKRTFASFGLAQSVPVTRNLTLDATLDSNRTLSGFDPASLVNPAHPASSGGNLGENGSIAEDFTAVTLGGTWRAGRWSATVRGEWRDGELADRKGVTFGAIRQLGEGSMVGTGFTWTRAETPAGASSEVFDGSLAMAHRPANSDFAFLAKLQFRSDVVHGAVEGEAGPAGRGALTITGNGRSDRIIASVSGDWTPRGRVDGAFIQRNEVGFFAAVRHNFDQYEGFDLAGTTLLGGLDLRLGLGDRFEIGATGTVRTNLTDKTTSFAFGPQIGFVPTQDVLFMVGYNIAGFRDPDFSAARMTDKGFFATVRMKFDADTFGFLGLDR